MTARIVSLERKAGKTLRATFAVDLDAGGTVVRIKGCQLHQYPGDPSRRWVLLPSQRHGGSFHNCVQIPDRSQHEALQVEILDAVDRYLADQAQEVAA